MIRSPISTAALVVVSTFLLQACSSLKELPPQEKVFAKVPATSGELADVSRSWRSRARTNESGFLLLERADEALEWRLALVDHAEKSIDAQYFIWQNDTTGRLLFERLQSAADRGVRVRVIVDDLAIASGDDALAAYSRHPNFEIKVFNPGKVRRGFLGPIVEFLSNFRELNRRMHNKMFVVDNRAAIVGGRNIGDPYFGLSKKYNFRDMDVLTVGPVVPEISRAFDAYWNSDPVYPANEMSDKASVDDGRRGVAEITKQLDQDQVLAASPYPRNRKDWSPAIRALPTLMHRGEAHFIQDDPVTDRGEEYRLLDMLDYLAAPSHEELIISTPYLIPVGDFLTNLTRLSSEGVAVNIITGGLDSNNHTVAHSHYKKYRRRVIEGGANLREFKAQPSPDVRAVADTPPVTSEFVSMHAKTLVGDRKRCFIGSLNLDPRAIVINTENGLLIDSPGLSEEIARQLEELTRAENSWEVSVDENNRLRWQSGENVRFSQPARSFSQRISDFFFRLLPIESQL